MLRKFSENDLVHRNDSSFNHLLPPAAATPDPAVVDDDEDVVAPTPVPGGAVPGGVPGGVADVDGVFGNVDVPTTSVAVPGPIAGEVVVVPLGDSIPTIPVPCPISTPTPSSAAVPTATAVPTTLFSAEHNAETIVRLGKNWLSVSPAPAPPHPPSPPAYWTSSIGVPRSGSPRILGVSCSSSG